ncbi:MAG: biotin--[acetyl-CoA-carboxylase] ligase [Candidatus Lambdaproteobacteria bacterium]|nr:biotin--[acetyl-CoA-carboxylase] ligase [Candidatus Lambdaproteobacteria bacterium]
MRPPLGHTIVRLDEAPSTNTLVLEREEYLAQHGLVVLARHQSAGRGRMGRAFASVAGTQLLFSVVAHLRLRPEQVPLCSLVAGLAVAQAVEDTLALRPELKWPNDVTLGGRKLCGILAELRQGPPGEARLVVGIGVNCLGAAADFPPELRPVLTTLAEHTAAPVDPEAVLGAILRRLDAGLTRLEAGETAALLAEWSRRAPLAGRRVRYAVAGGQREGVALGITAEGFLRIQGDDGAVHTAVSGEVDWLR